MYRVVNSLLLYLSPCGLEEEPNATFTPDRRRAWVGPEQYIQNLAAVAELSRRHNIRLVFVLFNDSPLVTDDRERGMHRDRVYNDLMRQVAAEYAVPLVDAGHLLDRDPSVYIDFAHFDARGHEMVAGLLKDVISDLLPSP